MGQSGISPQTVTMLSLLISSILLISPIQGEQATDIKEIKDLKMEMDEMRAEMKSLISREVSKAMSEIPYVMVCSYKNEWTKEDATVTFDEIISSYSFNGEAELQAGQQVTVYIHRNEELLVEGEWHSWTAEYNLDQGSRSVILHLSAGDTVHLGTGIFDGTIWRLVFCVSLTGYDP